MQPSDQPILVTGATGYVGGRLAPRLLAAGRRVRAVGRSLDKLACRPWAAHPNVELVKGDVQDASSLYQALKGCRAAFYLVHSMNPGTADYRRADRQAALNMAAAAEAAGLERMIYLGGHHPGRSPPQRAPALPGRCGRGAPGGQHPGHLAARGHAAGRGQRLL